MKEKNNNKDEVVGFILTEVSFVLLPLFVLLILAAYRNTLPNLWESSEWALAASVMYGQCIVKMIHTISSANRQKGTVLNYHNIAAAISLMILLGLAPSLTTLCLISISESKPTWLVYLQFTNFALSLITFIFTNRLYIHVELETLSSKD